MGCSYITPSKEDIYELINKASTGDEGAKELLIKLNTGLVKSIALKFTNRGYEVEDLMQIGFIGLLRAIQRFDTSYNVMFSTYAVPMILGEIKRYIRDDGRIKMSRQLKQEIYTVNRTNEEFYNQKGRYPRLSELSEMTGISNERLMEVNEAASAIIPDSLDDSEKPISEMGFSNQNYLEEENRRLTKIQLKDLICNLPERERCIVIMRYFQDMTQQQIAKRLGVSQVQVSRIEKKIIEKLKVGII